MGEHLYTLVLRSADESPPVARQAKKLLRFAFALATQGLVSPAGRSILDVVESSSGAVVARWDRPPSAEGSEVWMPHLQDELDRIGLEAFAAKYLARSTGVHGGDEPNRAEPEFDEAELDRLWATLPRSDEAGR